MERTQILDLMSSLKLYGMRSAYDEVMASGIKRQHEPPRIVGDLLQSEIAEKQARSIKYQMTIAKLPLAKDIDDFDFTGTPINAGFGTGSGVVTRLPEIVSAFDDIGVWVGLSGTTLIAVFAFIGFEHLVNVAEEMKNQLRTLPWALFLTLGLTALVYALVVWVAVVAVPPDELATSSAPLALVFERLTGMPLKTMSLIAVIATLNGIIVHVIMISRVLYGLATQGNLPNVLTHLNASTGTPLLATAIGVAAIPSLALAVPLAGLADRTARFTLVVFAIINITLIRIKSLETAPPAQAFFCPGWVPAAGLVASIGLLLLDLVTLDWRETVIAAEIEALCRRWPKAAGRGIKARRRSAAADPRLQATAAV